MTIEESSRSLDEQRFVIIHAFIVLIYLITIYFLATRRPPQTITTVKEAQMKSGELRAIQAPLKEKYKETPAAALITLKAQGRVGEGITCKIETGKAIVEAGLHEATGGTGLSVCSGDMLLEALVACAGVTLNAVATAIGVNIRDGVVRAEGNIDFRGTLGVSKETPVGFQNIRISFDLDTDASAEQMASLKKLTERYCVVFQTLQGSPIIETTYSTT